MNNPLEETFEIEPVEPIIENEEDFPLVEVDASSSIENYDFKDQLIDDEFNVIYKKALSAYNKMSEEMEFVEGKYKARVGEVSNQLLSTALNAAKEKMNLKQHKDKMVVKQNVGRATTNNNLFVGSHEEMMKLLKGVKNEKDT